MNKQYNQIIHPASYYRQVFTGCNSQAVSEDDKITLRLSPVRSPENQATDSQDHIRTLYGPPPRIEGFNVIQSLRSNAEAAVNEINLDKLVAADQILIETTHSVYSFTITDPGIPSGKLIGGVLGNRQVKASLVPSQLHDSSRFARRSLRIGSRLMFLIEHENYLRRLTTSTVTKILYRKEVRTRSLPVNARGVKVEHLSNDNSDI
ncbi:MAG TPA: hypothetical protein VLR90_08290 [Blastocatellia bacterium]|nr:hypothetical protein [Blastocatellia bacterium]